MQTRKPAPQRKTEIVAAVLRLADQIGPDRLTTNDVARAVGITQAAVFRHFPSKAALWLAAGEAIAHDMTAAWDAALATGGPSAQARLAGLIAAQLGQIAANPALPTILHSRELNVENPALRDLVQSLMLRFQGHLTDALAEMSRHGQLAPGLRAGDAAVFLISLVQGLAIRWSLGARNFDLVDEGMRLLDVQLGLLAPPPAP